MPAMSHSFLVRGWLELSAASGLGIISAAWAVPHTLALSSHAMPVATQSDLFKGWPERSLEFSAHTFAFASHAIPALSQRARPLRRNYIGPALVSQVNFSEFVKQVEAQMSDRRLYRSRRRFARIDAGTVAFIICAIGLVVSTLLIRANQVPNQKLQTSLSVAVGHPIAQARHARTARSARIAPELR
jgi:hypothetical protein